ncbi:hypothetical protein MJG53_005305 [Ovis ammon polii x Ovis aries]|uniref:Uncharacterized protein n=1 Tax=Ovis ammon polii x Ovis aries TaxID=2918886 RepID=A0ACB9VCR0_9CETA|nr:hypothetical protein MJG53_005305 [Ovis ammon polii x Ovis aries]
MHPFVPRMVMEMQRGQQDTPGKPRREQNRPFQAWEPHPEKQPHSNWHQNTSWNWKTQTVTFTELEFSRILGRKFIMLADNCMVNTNRIIRHRFCQDRLTVYKCYWMKTSTTTQNILKSLEQQTLFCNDLQRVSLPSLPWPTTQSTAGCGLMSEAGTVGPEASALRLRTLLCLPPGEGDTSIHKLASLASIPFMNRHFRDRLKEVESAVAKVEDSFLK